MLMVAVALLSLAVIGLIGGDLRRLGEIQLRAAWLLIMALALQVLVTTIIPDNKTLPLDLIHNFTYVLAAVFLYLNRHLRGLLVVAVGGALNGVTIFVNGGTLPARPGALETAGVSTNPGDFENSGVVENPKLAFLGDVFAIPAGWPFANVFSIGDVIICAGMAMTAYTVCMPEDRKWRFGPRPQAELR